MENSMRLVADKMPDDRVAAHRFRSVLTTAQGYAELVRRRLADPTPDAPLVAQTLDRLLTELAHLTRLVEEQFDPHNPSDLSPHADSDTVT